jgi:S-disulfanyl-L-cysteine oxidoreductase SoxD
MSMLKRIAFCAAVVVATSALAQTPQFGQSIAPADIAPWDISISPDGAGLPPGRGTAAQGESVYAAQCQGCHGEKGAGGPNDALVGGIGSLVPDKTPVRTVGSYWPYATGLETAAVAFFEANQLPELSVSRVLHDQIHRMFAHATSPALPTEFD